ncbi:hypothetical protein [Clostridium estertheticum]|uniref:Uncharacterized protein n=1 Tax=Clostridium estertheticum TaxID=238834 RepID=A0AA47EHM0_9CLOT|nr:hypothetical protein [Clostridium estertheticum]MBU3154999.1 hypothetical protein [Clostridium estertheticum]WAG58818.1 hypothetical protein LL038_14265 [Clostridium estertheticum]
MEVDFDYAFRKIQDEMSIEEIMKLDPKNILHRAIVASARNVYIHEGYQKKYDFYKKHFNLASDVKTNYINYQLKISDI